MTSANAARTALLTVVFAVAAFFNTQVAPADDTSAVTSLSAIHSNNNPWD